MFLGIDVGTGGTRAVLVDREGRVVASAASDHAPVRSEQIGWAEQQPEDWWRAAREAIARRDRRRRTGWREDRVHRTHRPDARLRDAGRGGRSAAPRAHLVRPAHPAGVRLARSKARPRAADRADLQPRAAQLHPHQAALGAHPSARNLRAHRARPLPQGLRSLSPHRRVRHRHAGGQRNASARRGASPLVRRGRRGRGDSTELAAASL